MLLSKVLNDYYVLPLGQSEIIGWDNQPNGICHISWADSDTAEQFDQYFPDQGIHSSAMPAIHKGEFCVIDTDGKVCAFIALDGADLAPKTNRLVVTLDGGLVQSVLSDGFAADVRVVDYDITDGADEDEITDMDQTGGHYATACIHGDTVLVDAAWVENVFNSRPREPADGDEA